MKRSNEKIFVSKLIWLLLRISGIDMNSQMAFTQSCKSPMARFASDSFTLHRIPLSFRIPQPLLKPIAAGFRTSRRKFSGIVCQTLPNPADTSSDAVCFNFFFISFSISSSIFLLFFSINRAEDTLKLLRSVIQLFFSCIFNY